MKQTIPNVFLRGPFTAKSKFEIEVSASTVRRSFLDFFCKENGHLHVQSSPVFSPTDPTLAFVNAGMNQFKNVFLGLSTPAAKKVANYQKCIRIGGKHNDLNQVGKDGTHHSFFEMLGNWSFGDYFKKKACELSWDLLTNIYNISPEKLYVTYFEGSETLGLGPDLEVRDIWLELGIKKSHILSFGMKENFWEMGRIGPCGVCTEIHYDHMPGRKEAGNLVNSNDKTISELWNIVFMQYNRTEDGCLQALDKHFVDTGMGYERLVAILQGKMSNYDTDLFLPLFEVIEKHSGHSGYTGKYGSDGEVDCDYRILADHGRMISVALSDGMIPNHQNKVRSIIRKSLAVCEKTFKSDHKLLMEVINRVAETFSNAHPQIEKNLSKIQYVIEQENEILKALQRNAVKAWKKVGQNYPKIEMSDVFESPGLLEGLAFIERNVKETFENRLSPKTTWILFDTFGIPPKTTEKLAASMGLKFDMDSFEEYQENCKEIKKKTLEKKFYEKDASAMQHETILESNQVKPSKDYFKHDYWVDDSGNYVFSRQPTTIEAIIWGNHLVNTITSEMFHSEQDRRIGLALDRTQLCSSERNRQSDAGTLFMKDGIVFKVENVVQAKGFIVHYGNFEAFPSDTELSVNGTGVLVLNEKRRLAIMRNHTALNLLKAAIREKIPVSGEKCSMVDPDKFILSFMTYKEKLDLDGIEKVDNFVNSIIKSDVPVLRRPLSHHRFQKMEDVAFFPGAELVQSELPIFEVNCGFVSVREYCTGAHVLSTSHVKDFVITKYYKADYCVYNIEGVTGEQAAAIKVADANLQQDWMILKEKTGKKYDELMTFRRRLTDSMSLSHVVKQKILKELKSLTKKTSAFTRNFPRETSEMRENEVR